MELKFPIQCIGKVRQILPNQAILVTLFLDETEITGEINQDAVPQELHSPGAIFSYKATNKQDFVIKAIPKKSLSPEEFSQLEAQSQAAFEGW